MNRSGDEARCPATSGFAWRFLRPDAGPSIAEVAGPVKRRPGRRVRAEIIDIGSAISPNGADTIDIGGKNTSFGGLPMAVGGAMIPVGGATIDNGGADVPFGAATIDNEGANIDRDGAIIPRTGANSPRNSAKSRCVCAVKPFPAVACRSDGEIGGRAATRRRKLCNSHVIGRAARAKIPASTVYASYQQREESGSPQRHRGGLEEVERASVSPCLCGEFFSP